MNKGRKGRRIKCEARCGKIVVDAVCIEHIMGVEFVNCLFCHCKR